MSADEPEPKRQRNGATNIGKARENAGSDRTDGTKKGAAGVANGKKSPGPAPGTPNFRGSIPTDINEQKFSNDPETHSRRLKIARLRWVRKFTIEQIIQATGTPERTVYRDLAAIKKANEKARASGGIKKSTDQVIAELELAHADRQRERWQEYHSTKDTGLRRRLLNDIATDEEANLKAMQSLGVVEKVAERVDLTTETWPEKVARLRAEREAARIQPAE